MKKCPFCAEEIQDEAIKCRFCGEILNQQKEVLNSQEEKTLREGKASWKAFYWPIFLSVILSTLGAINSDSRAYLFFGILFLIIIFAKRESMGYTVTNKRIRVRNGILSRKIDEIDIAHIRAIFLRQGVWGRIFDYGDIFVATAGAGTAGYEVKMKCIDNAQEIMTLIKSLQSNIKEKQRD